MKCPDSEHATGRPEDLADGEGRRKFLKLTAATMAAPLLMTGTRVQSATVVPVFPPSPPTVPWAHELPKQVNPLGTVSSLSPAPTEAANIAAGEAGRSPHQRWAQFRPGALLYEISATERNDWVYSPSYPPQRIWGYQANSNPDWTMPSATFFARYGRPLICRIHNKLPQNHVGFGTPEISTHLHNLHCGSESDGFPGDYYSPNKHGPTLSANGRFKDHLYSNVKAGFEARQDLLGDPTEALGTLFYHDHTLDFTAPNLYLGLAGFYYLFDELDSGNEADPNPSALRLPSHPYDYPLNFNDRRFDANGRLFYDQVNPEGVLGDKVAVNGRIEPVLRVAARKYRFRLLNTGPSRFYNFALVSPTNVLQKFTHISNDGNLFPAPLLNQTNVTLGVAERADIVVDFSKYVIGTQLYLVNRMRQVETRRPKDIKEPGDRVLKIIVDRYPPAQDLSRVPATLRPLPLITQAEISSAPVRRWIFERDKGMWAINGKFVDVNSPRAQIPKGGYEIWELSNVNDGWSHPIHIHFEEGRILQKIVKGVSVPIPVHERGRKDVFVVEPLTTLRVFLRFRDYKGKYPMHCHNLIHEDHAMMLRWDIV